MVTNRKSFRIVHNTNQTTLADLTDDELITLIKIDRHDAFQELVSRYQTLVLGLATRFLGDNTLGRDVAQDVFLSLWAERSRYKSRGVFSRYLIRVSLNRCHYVARQRKSDKTKLSKFLEQSTVEGFDNDDALESVLALENAKKVRMCLLNLPENPRLVLILRFTSDMSLEEIATNTGMPIGTVKSHISRGLKRLNKLLKKGIS